MYSNWANLKHSTPYTFLIVTCFPVLVVVYYHIYFYRLGIQSHSTERLREEIMPTTLASRSRTEPPRVATKSPDKATAGFTPSSSSKLVDASASASDLEMRPLLSSAAYKEISCNHGKAEKSWKTDPCSIQASVASTPLLKNTNANLNTVCKQGSDCAVLGQRWARKSWRCFVSFATPTILGTYILIFSQVSGNDLDGVTITPMFASPRCLASKWASAAPATVSLRLTLLLASTSFLSLINDAIISAFCACTTSGISPCHGIETRQDQTLLLVYLGNTVKRSPAGGTQQQVAQGSNLTAHTWRA